MRKASELHTAGRWEELFHYLDSLPAGVLSVSPGLQLMQADAALRLGEAHAAVRIANALLQDPTLSPMLRAKALLVRSSASRLRGFIEKALEDAAAAISILEADPSAAELLIEAHRQMGVALGTKGEIDQAVEHLERALKLCAHTADLKLQAEVENALGMALTRLGQWSAALAHFNSARAGYQKLGIKSDLGEVLDHIGWVYYLDGDYDLALETLKKALECARATRFLRTEAMALVNIGDTLQKMGRHQEALASYKSALDVAAQALEPRLTVFANIGTGSVYCALGDQRAAGLFLREAAYEAQRLDLRYEYALALQHQGVLEASNGNSKEALKKLAESNELLLGVGSQRELLRGYLHLAAVYLSVKQWRHLNATLRTLATMVQGLEIRSQLALEAAAAPAVISYAATKRIGGDLFTRLQAELEEEKGRHRPETVSAGDSPGRAASYPKVEVYSLGQTRVLVDGRKISSGEWGSQKTREFFLLLLWQKKGGAREELLEVLWPDLAATLTRNVFYNTVYRLRRTLYQDCVVQEDGAYRLNPKGAFWFDLDAFRQLVKKAGALPPGSEERASLSLRAVELYRGPFLQDCYEDWVDAIRNETERQYLQTLAALARFYGGKRDYEAAAQFLERLLAVDPTDSGAQEQLVRALLQGGRTGEAGRRYHQYRELARSELAAEPSKTFEELCREASTTS